VRQARRVLPALLIVSLLVGCAHTFDATKLGVPATLASPAGQPAQGSRFSVSSKAVFGFWGLLRYKEPSLRRALAAQLAGGAGIADLRVRCGAGGATC
jgi:hypothetical protein